MVEAVADSNGILCGRSAAKAARKPSVRRLAGLLPSESVGRSSRIRSGEDRRSRSPEVA